uniref:Putative ovule protein n=1 Tax=Solanum chacoense TaxID=4108 RepID=A0A0V0GV49_SOLCH
MTPLLVLAEETSLLRTPATDHYYSLGYHQNSTRSEHFFSLRQPNDPSFQGSPITAEELLPFLHQTPFSHWIHLLQATELSFSYH